MYKENYLLNYLTNCIITNYIFLFVLGSAQPKDFTKENAYHIKQIQKANRQKQQESAAGEPVKAVYKPDKFDHVGSKVAKELKVGFNTRQFKRRPLLMAGFMESFFDAKISRLAVKLQFFCTKIHF
jgi:hypothetical protein